MRARIESVKKFLDSELYVGLLGLLCAVGHIFSAEVFTVSAMLILTAISQILLKSLKPILPILILFIYQCSVKNSPSMPSFSDYYFTGRRVALFALLLAVAFSATVYVAVVKRVFAASKFSSLPFKCASIAFATALLLNGALSGEWIPMSLIFGFLQVLALIALPYLLIILFSDIPAEQFLDYVLTIAEVCALLLAVETLNLYLFGGVVSGGVADKGAVLYGWGIWTTAGVDIAVLIPLLFLGAMRRVRPIFRFALAHLTYLCCILTLSRNALVFGTLAFALSALFVLWHAPKRAMYKKVYSVLAAAFVFSLPLMVEPVAKLLSDFIDRGFSDNGRIALWRYGAVCFREAALFGKGFFALKTDTFRAEHFFPPMLHNTHFQLIASCGCAGLITYIAWQVSYIRAILRGRRHECIMLLVSVATFILMSQLDNFMFHIQPTFIISLTFASAYKLSMCCAEGESGG